MAFAKNIEKKTLLYLGSSQIINDTPPSPQKKTGQNPLNAISDAQF
jgi:hypothetical protein